MPTVGATIVELNDVEVYPPGPAHDQLVPDVVPVSVIVPPGQTGPELDAVANTGHCDHLNIVPSEGSADKLGVNVPCVAVENPEPASTV